MPPVLLHIALLGVLALPIVFAWLPGQPGHQASAAAWAIGWAFFGGLWVTHLVLSSGLLIGWCRVRMLKSLAVILLHLVSAAVIMSLLLVWARVFG